MSSFKLTYPVGATPLDSNEIEGLIPDYITNQKELNILEQQNIVEGMNWAERKKNSDILSITFCYELHKQMFNQVWKWQVSHAQQIKILVLIGTNTRKIKKSI